MKNGLLLFIILIAAACSKDTGGSNDNEAPAVTISSPTPNQQFSSGQTVSISGQLSDNQKISEVHVHISNVQTGALLIDIHRYPAAASYTLAESFQAQAGISYKIQVIAKDNSANEGRATVEISTN
jgi:hypothetical protein